jgi:DNA repair protein RadA/Sms
MRAKRLGLANPDCYLLTETNLELIIQYLQHLNPKLIIIDSVQTLSSSNIESPAGSLSQIRDCTARLSEIAKNQHITLILIGHITKDGYLAGPKLLEHMVDTVLYLRVTEIMTTEFSVQSKTGLVQSLI